MGKSTSPDNARAAIGDGSAAQLRLPALPIIIVSQLLGTSLWFSTNGVARGLTEAWGIGLEDVGFLTVAVQLGFIAGTLLIAISGLADRFAASRVFAISAVVGAAANLALAWVAGGFWSGSLLRLITGLSLAGVYPVGMKLVIGWAPRKAGLYLGWLVGMLTIGTALPHLIRAAAPDWSWQMVVSTASVLASIAALAVMVIGDGPNTPAEKEPQQGLGAAVGAFRNPAFRAAAIGYFGHMWELYAFWTMAPVLIATALAGTAWDGAPRISLLTFVVIAVGGLGCIFGGRVSLRVGSRWVAVTCLACSGSICLIFPLFERHPHIILLLLLVWGFAVVPDSPQFSALAAATAPPNILGGALALQNCIGFLLSSLSIWIATSNFDLFGASVTWLLLPGPIIGLTVICAIWRSPKLSSDRIRYPRRGSR